MNGYDLELDDGREFADLFVAAIQHQDEPRALEDAVRRRLVADEKS